MFDTGLVFRKLVDCFRDFAEPRPSTDRGETVMNHLVRGERAMEAGNLELAREIYEKALQEETNNCETTILNFILGVVF